ncbi:hypothetical protein BH18GEM1_BH18GEM1_19460 [soil metagenome]
MDMGTPPLRRSTERYMIAGVIGGLAEHFDLNVTLLRIVYLVGSILSAAFPGVLVYMLLWILIPKGVPGEPIATRA